MGERALHYKIIPSLIDAMKAFDIIVINEKGWTVVAGPYMTKEEAEVDLRILEYENRE